MARIKEMSTALANQIAAGEVVERPASVVKELVENSLDAGADDILIEVVEAGIQQIKVTDNGSGIHPDDLKKVFLPHATSKVYQLSDLYEISSLGFRGEALASIASVGKVKLVTGYTDEEGKLIGRYIEVEGSEFINEGSHTARPGTSITVDSLFYNTPARLKHLSTLRTEMRHILSFIQKISLAHPDVRFRLLSDGEEVFITSGSGDLRQALAHVYQPKLARQLLDIENENNDFKISGYISPPQLTRGSRFYIHWIINGRVVDHYGLSQVLIKAYDKQLMTGRYPIAAINIEVDPRLLDVNIHPTKQTIRLSKEDTLAELLTKTVAERLFSTSPVPQVDPNQFSQVGKEQFKRSTKTVETETFPLDLSFKNKEETETNTEKEEVIEKSEVPVFEDNEFNITESFNYETNQEEVQIFEIQDKDLPTYHPKRESFPYVHKRKSEQKETKDKDIDFLSLRYIGQIHGTYLVAESKDSFYLIDQHAAHERIRYENFMKDFDDSFSMQELLIPIVLKLTLSQEQSMIEYQEKLEELGIELSAFGPQTYQMQSYPTWMEKDDVEDLVLDIIDWLADNKKVTIKQLKEESIMQTSCKGAIKANEYLPADQAIELIHQLADVEDPYHCIHGRPTFIEFDQRSIEKMFKRIPDWS